MHNGALMQTLPGEYAWADFVMWVQSFEVCVNSSRVWRTDLSVSVITEIKDAEMLKSSFAAEEPDDAGELNYLGCFFLETSRRPDKHVNTLGGGTKAHQYYTAHNGANFTPFESTQESMYSPKRACFVETPHPAIHKSSQRPPPPKSLSCVLWRLAHSLWKANRSFPRRWALRPVSPEPLLRQEKNISR